MLCAVTHCVWRMSLQKQLSRATRMYERRIEWLSLASRRIWGTVCEKRYLPPVVFLSFVGVMCDTALNQLMNSLLVTSFRLRISNHSAEPLEGKVTTIIPNINNSITQYQQCHSGIFLLKSNRN